MSDWYYAANNEQKGPINESELKANLASNKIPIDTLVWKDGMDNWTPANQVPAFTFRAAPAPAAVQPVAGTPAPSPAAAPASAPASASASAPAAKASPEVNNPESTQPVNLQSIMGKPEALEVDADDAEANKIFGILSYVGILCFLPLISAPQSPYAKYHANQGFAVFLLWIATVIVVEIIVQVFHVIGLYALDWFFGLVYIAPIGLMIYGIINAARGKCVPLPVIGGIKLLK